MGNSQASGAVGEASSPEERERAFEELCVGYDQKTGSEQLHAAEAIELHKKGKLFLIDTSGEEEYKYACIPGATLLSPTAMGMTLVSTVGSGMRYVQDELPDLANVPEDVTIVCSCTAGLRSGYCAVDLTARLGGDRTVKNLHGGIIAWFNANGPVGNPETGEAMGKVHAYSATWGRYVKDGKAHY